MSTSTQLTFRSDTSANWTSSNPILLEGEPGYETNTKKLKVGDGVTAWTSLPYQIQTSEFGTLVASQRYTSPGTYTYTVPNGTNLFMNYYLIGGGGGGTSTTTEGGFPNSMYVVRGGIGGASLTELVSPVVAGSTINITVGAGGSGAGYGGSPVNGSNTTLTYNNKQAYASGGGNPNPNGLFLGSGIYAKIDAALPGGTQSISIFSNSVGSPASGGTAFLSPNGYGRGGDSVPAGSTQGNGDTGNGGFAMINIFRASPSYSEILSSID